MNVYKRPMFLQGGGAGIPVAAPPNAAPPMAAAPPNAGAGAGIPPELQMALAGAEQEGAAIGQGIGQKFVTDMMDGLDSAEDYEQAINAIRGNELPLSARYDELGEIVGEEDAKETPESVLALVQPAIMMTEEGAMNSGIGNLMKDLTGDIPMEGGMEGGVGSLMAAGQPAEPPMGPPPPGPDPTALGPTLNGTPQGFAVGGAVNRFRGSPVVQNFQTGGLSSLANLYRVDPTSVYYERNLAELEDVIDTDEQTKLAKSQILFDIARRAAAWAGGVNPETGQRMTGSALSQFATAASGLPKTIGEQMAAIQAQKQKLKLAAYQGAQTQRAAAIGRATKTFKMGEGDVLYGIGPDGKFVERGRGAPKTRTPVPMIALMSDGKKLFFNQVADPGGEKKITAYQEIKPKATVTEIFKARPEPAPTKATAPQEPFELTVISKDGKQATVTLPPDIAAKGGPAIRKWVKANDNLKYDFGGPSGADNFLKSYKVKKLSTSGAGDKLTLSQLRGLSTNPDLMDQYAGNSLVDNYFAADTSGKKLIREQNAQYELSLLQQVSPYVDKDSGKTLPATGLSQEGEAALRNRLRLLDELDKNDANYERDKKLLTVSSRLKAHVDRLDDASLAEVELDTMSRELRELTAPGGEGQPPSDKKDVNKFLSRFDFTDIGGGFPGFLNKVLNKVGAVAQLDLQADAAAASGVLKDMYQRTTRILSQLNRVSTTKETKRTYEAIEELNPVPQDITVTRESLMRRAGEIRATLEDSLADTLRRGRLATQQNDPEKVMKSLDEAKSVRRLLYSWAYVESSLRGGARYSVVTKQGRQKVRALFGKKGP